MARHTPRNMKFENLEDRRLMTANIILNDGVLEIEGTNDDDTIEITYSFQTHEVLVAISDADGNVIENNRYGVANIDSITVDTVGGTTVSPIIPTLR